jgi:hypothetical protein
MRALTCGPWAAGARRVAMHVCGVALAAALLAWPAAAAGQVSSVGVVTIRPFVTGLVPVVGPSGFVGGVSIDAAGVVAKSDVETLGRLRELRLKALVPLASELAAASPLRKISLRGIAREIDRLRRTGQPVSDELQNLAGLQRAEFVLVYPERGDIVLAGFAEGWKVDPLGNVVGPSTGRPVLQLDDLIVALRTAKNAATESGITCSIDPTPEGSLRLRKLLDARGLPMNDATLSRLEETLGPQQITITGVPPASRFACVLVAADFSLKRLGMNHEPAPVEGMPSYLEMLRSPSAPSPRHAMPRFWLAPRYDALLKDADGLAWQLRGSGVKAEAEDGAVKADGTPIAGRSTGRSPARQWAETMTAKYDALSAAMPVFAELRNCMDLAVVAALLAKEDLPSRASCDLSLLLDESQVAVAEYHVPRTVASQASLVRKGRQWIVAVSGGVEVDSWSVLQRVEPHPALALVRGQSQPPAEDRWWWD